MGSLRAYFVVLSVVWAGTSTQLSHAEVPPPENLPSLTDLPADQNIQFNIPADSTDPTSAVLFKVNVPVRAVDSIGNWVAWEATSLYLREYDATGQLLTSRSTDLPPLSTTDGLWWVRHDDPNTPLREEFAVLPLMVGTVYSDDPAVGARRYELQGAEYIVPLEGAPYPTTGSLSYMVAAEETPDEPVVVVVEGPVEIPPFTGNEPYPCC